MIRRKILLVLPYPFYFGRRNNYTGGHISHMIGVIDALIRKKYYIDILSDMEIPEYHPRFVSYHRPILHKLRTFFQNRKGNPVVLQSNPSQHDTRSRETLLSKIYRILGHQIYYIDLLISIYKLTKTSTAELIYVRHNPHAFIVAFASKLLKLPLVIEVNTPVSLRFNDDSRHGDNAIQKPKMGFGERFQYHAASVISVVSPYIADWIASKNGKAVSSKILLNPNGVDTKRFRPLNTESSGRSRFGVKPDRILMGFAAAFVWYNAIEDLLSSFEIALKSCKRLHLLLIGDSDMRLALEKLVFEKHLTEYVTFTGRIPFDEMPEILNSCDIVLSHFNFGNKPAHICSIKHLEALAAGKAIIATDVGYANFAVRHLENGILVPQGDIEGFANAILKLASNRELRDRLGRRGRMDADHLHSWDVNVDRIISKLHETRSF